MPALSRPRDLVLPLTLVASLAVILVPLPPSVMDILLAVNLAASVLVLLTTVVVRTPLEFSVFPTVLLTATLGRLVLNVATTRLILRDAGSAGREAAGGIIEGFGSFVAGDEIVVGLVIFAIILLIQFLVVTKGATRISEVAARFALDGMPGRQMAIDADVNAGIIDQQEAHRRREQLARQSDFYAAMDGASKFVRGDAIAGLAITLINILGGLCLGVFRGGMSLGEAADVFTRLTIGDGLVSQLPAFLIAVAAGLLITRSGEHTNLPSEFLRQLLLRPEPLLVAAVFLGCLTFTRLPAAPLVVVAGSFAGIALILTRSPQLLDDAPAAEAAAAPPEQRVEDLLQVDPLEMEIGVGLLRLADPQRGGDLLERITGLRQRVAVELGMVVPQIRIRDNLQLPEYGYRLKIFERVVAEGRAYPLRILAAPHGATQRSLDGIPDEDPISGRPAWWIDPANAPVAAESGFELRSAAEVVVGHLRQVVRRNAAELLTRDATQRLLDQLRQTSPAVVEEIAPDKRSLGRVQQILQGLLSEGVSIRNLPTILETVCDGLVDTQDVEQLIDVVRRRTVGTTLANHRDASGHLNVITLAPEWEQQFTPEPPADSLAGEREPLGAEVLTSEERSEFCRQVRATIQPLLLANQPPILLVSSALRSRVRRTTQLAVPDLTVLSYSEIPRDLPVQSIGIVEQAISPNR